MIWIITDTHFHHKSLIENQCRPQGYEEKIYKSLAVHIKPQDILIHLGDFCWANDELENKLFTSTIVCKKKWLILGNHDRKGISWYLSKGWDFCGHKMELDIFGLKILFSHIPQPPDSRFWDLNIHGHFHNYSVEKIKEFEPQIYRYLDHRHHLVSMENNNYQPVNLETIIKNFKK